MSTDLVKPQSTLAVCRDIYRKQGIRGLNKGANAVALRQMTGWASRIGITRFNEGMVRKITGKGPGDRLSNIERDPVKLWRGSFELLESASRSEQEICSPDGAECCLGHSNRNAIRDPVQAAGER